MWTNGAKTPPVGTYGPGQCWSTYKTLLTLESLVPFLARQTWRTGRATQSRLIAGQVTLVDLVRRRMDADNVFLLVGHVGLVFNRVDLLR